MELSKYVACICEGAAEQAIIELLLENDRLIFNREQLLEGEVLRCRSAKNFESQYLRKGFTEQITVIRILDSHGENFKLSKAYTHKIKVVNVVTAPEIEMLVIINENKYSDYKNKHSDKKPSEYCKMDLGYSDVKRAEFINEYFSNIDDLVNAIRNYKSLTKISSNEYTLADLLI